MNNCTDKSFERNTHAYELGILSADEERKFEIHLIECNRCFSEVLRFQNQASLLLNSTLLRQGIADIVKGSGSAGAFWAKLRGWLWPEIPRIRMAICLSAIVLIFSSTLPIYKVAFDRAQVIEFYDSVRGDEREGTRTIYRDKGGVAVLNFPFPMTQSDDAYLVRVISYRTKEEIYSGKHRSTSPEVGRGTISIPVKDIVSGYYELAITYPPESQLSTPVSYKFLVE